MLNIAFFFLLQFFFNFANIAIFLIRNNYIVVFSFITIFFNFAIATFVKIKKIIEFSNIDIETKVEFSNSKKRILNKKQFFIKRQREKQRQIDDF